MTISNEPVTHFDVLALGAGSGGYVSAIRAAQLGKTVAVVEDKYWGGSMWVASLRRRCCATPRSRT
jgi:phytoene dehydrogenase-like protein